MWLPLGRASGARAAGATEVLFIIDFLDFWDFLGFPILLLGFPRISTRISIRISTIDFDLDFGLDSISIPGHHNQV